MPLVLTSTVAAEIKEVSLSAIDLIEANFGNSVKRYWSTSEIPSEFLKTEFPGVSRFEPRIISVGSRRWTLGSDSSSLSLTLAKTIGDPSSTKYENLSDFAKQYGMGIFEGAELRHHRLFPNIKESYKNYWFGYGSAPIWHEDILEWDVEFGFGNFRQTFGRRIQSTCPHTFAGGPSADCPYDPAGAIGVPLTELLVSAGAGTDNTKIIGSGFSASAKVGWIAWNRTNNAFAQITEVVSDTEVKISSVIAGEGGAATFVSGNKIALGPKARVCPKTVFACKGFEMFGPSEHSSGAGDKRRYFGGNAEAAQVKYITNLLGQIDRGRFGRERLGNQTLEGKVIPVIVGLYRVRGIQSLYWAPAGRFQHGFFIQGEGEMVDVAQPIINGFPSDDNPPKDLITVSAVLKNDSFIKYGYWSHAPTATTGIEDSRATSTDIAKQVRRAVGRRKSWGVMSGKLLDTYGDAVHGNPYLFNNASGGGISFHGLSATRNRIESDGDSESSLTGEFDCWGLLFPLPASLDNNTEDGARFNLQGLKYTGFPNPIQVANAFATDNRWGIGLSSKRVLETSVKSTSDFCEEFITSTQGAQSFSELEGTVATASTNILGTSSRTFIFTKDLLVENNKLNGRRIIINPGNSKAFSTFVLQNRLIEATRVERIREMVPGVARIPGTSIDGEPAGMMIVLMDAFPAGKEPAFGNIFRVQVLDGPSTKRFKANGALADDISNGEMLQNILDNCFGTSRTNGEKIEFLIRKKLTNTELNDIVSDGVFTDRGAKPNIIRDENGKSSLRVWRESIREMPNEISVEFADAERNFQTSRITVFTEEAQIKAEQLLGESGDRKVIRETIKLNLTTSKDQAIRILTLRARQRFVENLFTELEVSLNKGFKPLPGDVIAIDSNTIAANFNSSLLPNEVMVGGAMFFRVLEKEEVDKFVVRLLCQVHVNGIFENDGSDFGLISQPDVVRRERGLLPLPALPLTPSERVIVEKDKKVRNFIKVRVTYPNIT